jgi:LmbE family N-acetylglucosaminyl deacetylase/glycosyltransferase involved in cell wall biosynthesis
MKMKTTFVPPTRTTRVSARRVLALSPHYDDEVFGCGGLLAQLAESGAEIRVVYLTDSSGGDEVVEDREAYAERRRAEAQRGLDILGVEQLETLPIRDGSLSQHLDTAAEAIRRAAEEHRPDLLLSVSPCEITADHRSAFASLHRALSSLRGDSELDGIMAGCRILLYEVNHPGYPSLLVDVSREIDRITAAIEAHESQLELHNYREAAIGMRHFRALSLPAEVEAAEGYREITLNDLVTHGHTHLVRRLGGVTDHLVVDDGPLVSVIVRTMDRPQLLAEALASLAASTYRRVEVVLVNDGGTPPEIPTSFPFPVVRVEMGENRGRAAAANAGVEAATGDYLAFLDDDDLAEPEHLETLVGLVAAEDVRVAYTDAAVGVYELNPEGGWREVERRLPYSRDYDAELLLLDNYIPFNTLLIERSLFAEAGVFDTGLEFFEDWDFLIRLAALTTFHHLRRVTAEYRHFRGAGHHVLGDRPHERGDFLRMKARIIARYRERHHDDLLARVIDRLRGETVEEAEAAASLRSERADLRMTYTELEDSYHRTNGECETLRGDRTRLLEENDQLRSEVERIGAELGTHRRAVAELEAEVARLQEEERTLKSSVADQDLHLGKVYAELERLSGIIEAMERTKAWRWHKRVEKLRGK